MRPLHNQNKFIKNHFILKNHGFTIIEILVAMVLIVLVLSLTLSDTFSSKQELEEDTNKLERAIRYISDEAALRNTVVRLRLNLEATPQEFSVEYGPSDNFILPSSDENETQTQSLEEIEEKKKKEKEINLKFNKIQEFQESNITLSENVRIIGAANSSSNSLQGTGDFSIYSFPTGEKDQSLIVIATDEEVISLKIDSFTKDINKKREPIPASSANTKNAFENIGKEIFEQWKREL